VRHGAPTGVPGPPSHPEPPDGSRRARRLAWLYATAALVLLPWIAYLAITLPKRNLDLHYRAAWVGFDILLVFAIVRTAYMAFRTDERVQLSATATATLLIVDAWFDITTSSNRSEFLAALVLAAFVEIPAAIFSLYLAHHVNRRVWEMAVAAQGDEAARPAPRGDPPPRGRPGT
jgi:lysylphosphatidylglycerol synthetase-like protein (DUF2156 family)